MYISARGRYGANKEKVDDVADDKVPKKRTDQGLEFKTV
jgi:hypothetical protein